MSCVRRYVVCIINDDIRYMPRVVLDVLQTESMRKILAADALTDSAFAGRASAPTALSALLSDSPHRLKAFRLGTTEPASIKLIRDLCAPATVIVSLALCLYVNGQHLSFEFAAEALIAFLVSSRVLSAPRAAPGVGHLQVYPTVPRLLLEWTCVVALLAFVAIALGLIHLFPRGALMTWLWVTPLMLLVANYWIIRFARYWLSRPSNQCRHIIIGATEVGLELAKRVQQGGSAGQFMGFFDFRDRDRLPQLAPEHWVGACKGAADFVNRHAVDTIYIALPISTAPRIAELLRELRDTTASIYFVPPNIFALDLVQPQCIEIQGIPAFAVCETPHQGMPGIRKRALDLVLGAIALLLTGPLMLAIAVTIKLSSRGPVLFRQRRYGLNGEEIFIYKFRSMKVLEDGAIVPQAKKNDQRVEPLGRLLRRTSLDELPQILNVLEGKMSFVGPRPHAVAHNEQYRKLISGYMIRHKVRPGMTGWAQINGLRGETDTVEKMRKRVEFDIDYVKNWSLWLDFKILFRTALIVLRGDQAY